MSDADFAQLVADLARLAARLAEIDARELGRLAHAPTSLPTPKGRTPT
jgi:hypothetical protein